MSETRFKIYDADECNEYERPFRWCEISLCIKKEQNYLCRQCGTHHKPDKGRGLAVRNLNGFKRDCRRANLALLCTECWKAWQEAEARCENMPKRQESFNWP